MEPTPAQLKHAKEELGRYLRDLAPRVAEITARRFLTQGKDILEYVLIEENYIDPNYPLSMSVRLVWRKRG